MNKRGLTTIYLSLIGCIVISILLCGCAEKPEPFAIIIEIDKNWVLRTNMPMNKAEKLTEKFKLIFPYYEELLPFKSKMNRRFKITLFDNSTEFQEYQRQKSMTHSENGFYRFELGELALLYQGMDTTVRTLYHEAFHAYLQERIIHPPQWLNEGLAEYFEKTRTTWFSKLLVSPASTDWAGTLSKMDRNNTIPNIADIVEYDWPDRQNLSKDQYALSWSLVHFFKESGGKKRNEEFNRYLELLYNKKEPKKAFHEVWPDLDELNSDWHSSIKKIVVKNFFLM